MALLFELFVYCNEISLWLGAGSCVRDTLIWLRWNCWIGSKNRCKFFLKLIFLIFCVNVQKNDTLDAIFDVNNNQMNITAPPFS